MYKKIVFTYLFFISIDTCLSNYVLNGDFKECLVESHQNLLKLDKCPDIDDDDRQIPDVKSVNRKEGSAFLFSKHQYVLEGLGQECSMKLRHFKLSTDIFFNKYSEQREEIKKLSRFDCLNIVTNNLCNGHKMNCKNKEECVFLEERDPQRDVHPWMLGSHTFTLHECKFRNRLVMTDSLKKNVIHDTIGSCEANDLYCELSDSIVIWKKDLIRTCLLERILYIWDLYSHKDADNNIAFYYSRNQSLLFTPIEKQPKYSVYRGKKWKECGGFDFIETTEGLFLSLITDDATRKGLSQLPESKVKMIHLQEKDIRDVLISQEDYSLYTLFKMNLVFACSAFLNTIRSNINNDNTFVVVNEMGYANDLIIYFNHGMSYLPVCMQVKNITIFKEQKIKDMCFEDIQIIYRNERTEKYKRGFLRKNGIITQFSKRVACDLTEFNEKSIFMDEIMIQRKENIVTLVNFNESLKTVIRSSLWNTNELHRLFEHHSILNNGTSLFENIEGLFDQHVHDMEGSSNIIHGIPVGNMDQDDDEQGLFSSIVTGIKNFFSSIWNTIVQFVYGILLVLFIIFLVYFVIKCVLTRCGSCKLPKY